MNTIVANVLMREAEKAQSDTRPFKIVVLFCCVGLLASLCMASLGFDVSAGFFWKRIKPDRMGIAPCKLNARLNRLKYGVPLNIAELKISPGG